jgi:hypothetical protein
MASQLRKFFYKYFPDNKRINVDPKFNSFWMKFLRSGYYSGCLILGMTAIAGLIALTMLILATVLMSIYLTAPVTAATISTIMIGLAEWGSLATVLTGVLLLGPWLFNKTAWLFKLTPPDEPYNFLDALRDAYHVVSHVLSLLLRPVIFLLTHIGAFFSWRDATKKEGLGLSNTNTNTRASQCPQIINRQPPLLIAQSLQQEDSIGSVAYSSAKPRTLSLSS